MTLFLNNALEIPALSSDEIHSQRNSTRNTDHQTKSPFSIQRSQVQSEVLFLPLSEMARFIVNDLIPDVHVQISFST